MPTCNPTAKKAINVKATNATSQIAILTSRYLLDLRCWLCSLCKTMPCNVIYDQWQPLKLIKSTDCNLNKWFFPLLSVSI